MERSLAIAIAGALALAQLSCAVLRAQDAPHAPSASRPDPPSGDLPSLPAAPRGVSTILGGEIRGVNPVLDEFSLYIYGERPMKIFFDPRTQVYRNGLRIPVFDFGPADHASVQTVLDGANVYAVSIHILSQAPEGDCHGLILSYDQTTGKLVVESDLSPQPIHLFVPAGTPISRTGERQFTAQQSGSWDLVRGTLVSVHFASSRAGQAVASRISILAVPGSAFIFAGNITYLDIPAGRMALVDPRDGKSYQILFDPDSLPVSANLRIGENVMVTASYNGSSYVAREITMN